MKLLLLILSLNAALAANIKVNSEDRWWSNILNYFFGGEDENLKKVNFRLHVTSHKGWWWDFKFGEDSQKLVDNGYDPKNPTKLLAHGYTDNGDNFCPGFVDAYFEAANADDNVGYNIICIDWEPLANGQGYFDSRDYAIDVGKKIGDEIIKNMLINDLGQDPKLIHVIGHSMGSHLAGKIGKETEKRSLKKIGRITALDPASPGFEGSKSNQLTKDDAEFVDVIHTNGGKFLQGDVGIEKPIGTIDFYPNGGKHMPGCPAHKEMTTFIGKIYQVVKKLMNTKCSHQKVRFYFEDSIKNHQNAKYLASTECESYERFLSGGCKGNVELPMGEGLTLDMVNANQAKEKQFFLQTKDESPFDMTS